MIPLYVFIALLVIKSQAFNIHLPLSAVISHRAIDNQVTGTFTSDHNYLLQSLQQHIRRQKQTLKNQIDDEEINLINADESNSNQPETSRIAVNPQHEPPPPQQIYEEPSDSPDRALAIVSELKANAALFAAFAYGGLSLPSSLSVTESKVTSISSTLSTSRPIPGNDLIPTFVILDVVTLCLMISCVAASQLLIYRLMDGSWYDSYIVNHDVRNDTSNKSTQNQFYNKNRRQSALARLVTDYQLEFTVARTTFDLGLVALLLAVAFRTIAIFDIAISLPVVILLGGTCILLGIAYLNSYFTVFRKIQNSSNSPMTETASIISPDILAAVLVVGSSFYFGTGDQGSAQPKSKALEETFTKIETRLKDYSQVAGVDKLATVQGNLAIELGSSSTSKSKIEKGKKSTSKDVDSNKKQNIKTPSETTIDSPKPSGTLKDTISVQNPTSSGG